MRKRWAALAAGVVLGLGGCRIETVFDHETAGQPLDYVTELAALPDGGFAAYDCAFDGGWAGAGLFVVRPGRPAEELLPCGEAVDVATMPDGRLLVSFGDWLTGWGTTPRLEVLDPADGSRQVVFDGAGRAEGLGEVAVTDDGRIFAVVYFEGRLQIHEITGPTTSRAVPGTDQLGYGDFLAADDGTLTVAGLAQVIRVAPDGTRSVVAGTGVPGSSGDGGPATSARIGNVAGLDRTPDGGLLLVDSTHDRVRRVDPQGRIWTVAGGGTSDDDGVPAWEARLDGPADVAVAGACWYIADGPYFDTKVRAVGGDSCPDLG